MANKAGYTDEYSLECADYVISSGEFAASAAKELGTNWKTLPSWARDRRAELDGRRPSKAKSAEVRGQKKRIRELEMESSLLKFAAYKAPMLDEHLVDKPTTEQMHLLLGLTERRYDSGSTILCSQRPIDERHRRMGGGARGVGHRPHRAQRRQDAGGRRERAREDQAYLTSPKDGNRHRLLCPRRRAGDTGGLFDHGEGTKARGSKSGEALPRAERHPPVGHRHQGGAGDDRSRRHLSYSSLQSQEPWLRICPETVAPHQRAECSVHALCAPATSERASSPARRRVGGDLAPSNPRGLIRTGLVGLGRVGPAWGGGVRLPP